MLTHMYTFYEDKNSKQVRRRGDKKRRKRRERESRNTSFVEIGAALRTGSNYNPGVVSISRIYAHELAPVINELIELLLVNRSLLGQPFFVREELFLGQYHMQNPKHEFRSSSENKQENNR